jgi:hypothetical protein
MTVWIYVDMNREVGDKDHLKVFASDEAAEGWLLSTIRKASLSRMRFRTELQATAYRLLAAFLILKSSIRLPERNCAISQRGRLPRPAQVSEG